MKLRDLTRDDLVEILRLYEEHCGFGMSFEEAMFHQTPKMVLTELRSGLPAEYKIGSRWDGHSKIFFETDERNNVVVSFSPNFDPADRKGPKYEEALQAQKTFGNAVADYLNGKDAKRKR